MTRLELLAPAKDVDCGLAAINCGADAVYIGAARFGARERAGNSLEDIAMLLAHAHTYWAKVYVTLNTLLKDDELLPALRLIKQLYELGVDGLIIQDAGLLECELPPIPLIASTQMHNATPEKVAFLEQVGFTRAILARELDLAEITAIRRATSRIALECFVHGSLCVCYSGQCYLSYALGGRSGNRGQCAQPCRKAYTLRDARGQTLPAPPHLLSLRDLNLADELRALVDAGVTSFKIEGRLKDRAYITNIVSHYRARLDALMAGGDGRKSSSGVSVIDFTPHPDKTFNRGYSRYFLQGQREPITSPDTPKMLGERLGAVELLTRRAFSLDTTADLHNGDGICFFDRQRELRGTVINAVEGPMIIPDKLEGLERGAVIYRNHDHAFLGQLAKSKPRRTIAVELTLSDTREGLLLLALDEDGNRAEARLACEHTLADKPDNALATIRKSLEKMGGTAFHCTGVTIQFVQPYFLPVATLNTLRRAVLERLSAVRAANRPVEQGHLLKNAAPYPQQQLDYRGNVLNRAALAFYRRHGVTHITPAAEYGLDMLGRQVMTTKYCLKDQLGYCRRHGGAPLAEPLSLYDAEGNRLELHFDCARCEMHVYLGPRKT
jgi:putative protease